MIYPFYTFLLFFSFLLFLTSCGSHSLDDFQEEGEGVIRSIIQELKTIHTRGELSIASTTLQRQFDRLVSIMIAAEEFGFSNQEVDKGGELRPNHELSDQLRVELNRLYHLEGGRQMIEKCQEKALYRLDAFERRKKPLR